MTRYVVVGAGAVGSTLAAQFDSAGIEYVLVARGVSYDVLSRHGLRFVRPDGERRIDVNVVDGASGVSLRSDDVLLSTVKAQDSETAVADWAFRSVEGTTETAAQSLPVVTFQNGLESERTALRRFHRVYGVSLWFPGTHVEPGRVIAAGRGVVALAWIGGYPHGSSGHVERIARDLEAAHIPTQVVVDIQRWKAAKLIGNLLNAVDVFDASPGEIADARVSLEAEAAAVFAAAGVSVASYTESTLDMTRLEIAAIDGHSSAHKSTWQSVVRGGSVETDYLNGEIALLGRLHGVPTPINDALQTELGRIALCREAPGVRRLAEVLHVGSYSH